MRRPRVILIFFIFFFLGCINATEEVVQDDALTISNAPNMQKAKLAVVLSFDYEGVSKEQNHELEPIFKLIEKHNATATFFIMGKKAKTDPEEIKEVYKRNYSLGLHTYYHNFPIFNADDAALIGRVYNKTSEYEWDLSFKTKESFYEDIIRNREVVMEAIENSTTPTMFRCPSLVINWTLDPLYFETLKRGGIKIDSSIYQDFKYPRPFYFVDEVIEVPVVASEKRLDDFSKALGLAERCARAEVPLVMYIHPQNMDEGRIKALNDYLDELETEYDVTYLKVDGVPEYYTSYITTSP